jgi:hypothetical protein
MVIESAISLLMAEVSSAEDACLSHEIDTRASAAHAPKMIFFIMILNLNVLFCSRFEGETMTAVFLFLADAVVIGITTVVATERCTAATTDFKLI